MTKLKSDLAAMSDDGLKQLIERYKNDEDSCRSLWSLWFLLQEVKEQERAKPPRED